MAITKQAAQQTSKGLVNSKYNKPGFVTPQDLMAKYHKQFGDDLLTGKYEDGTLINKEKEAPYIENMRSMYKTLAQPGDKVFRVGKGDTNRFRDKNTRGQLFMEHIKDDAAPAIGTFGLLNANPIVQSVLNGRHERSWARKYPGHFTSPTANTWQDLGRGVRNAAKSLTGKASLGLTALPLLVGSLSSSKKPHTDVSAAEAKRRARLKDDELLRLLRGQVVTKEKVTQQNDYIA